MKQEINNFMQTDSESVYQAWERLAAMLRKCPHHGIQDPDILYIFYHGLKPSARNVIDAASGGSIMGKTTTQAMQLLNEISENAVQWPSDRMIIKKTAGVNQVEALNSLTQQIATLTQKVEAFQVGAHSSSQLENCDVCQGNHPNHECQVSTQNEEQVNMIGYRNNYSFGSPMAQKHPGFQWNNPNGAENPQRFFNQKQQVQGPPGFQNQNRGQQDFQKYQQPPQRAHQQSLEDMMYKFIKATDEKFESQSSAIKNLEIQMSQLATLMSEKIKGALPSNTEKNPKEHLKAISLRSGKTLDDPYADRQGKPQEVEQKLGDPGSFTIPCTVGGAHFEKALCDSGASINLMPFSIFRKLELGEMKDTGVSLQLADQSTKKPKGIIENILVRVDKFVFPVDFIVLEMEENTEVPLILGRPFLATWRAIIDVHQGQLILRVDQERVIFDMQKMMKYPGDESSASCFQIDLLDDLVDEYKDNQLITNSLERCLVRSEQEYKLIEVLRKHKRALGWTIADIKGINPAICIHRILMEENYKPIVQPQRRLNPAMQEVVKKEVVKLLAAGIIYPISDSPWVSPVQVVPKKGDSCRKAFEFLKKQLTNAPIVVSPDWSQPFEIMCDARTKVTVFTDHAALKYLLAKKDARPRLLRWILLLQEFDLEIKDRKGSENQVADHLSRLENPPTEILDIQEEFPDEHIFSVATVVNRPP
ncbi:PREDICTED: uncharacterized protein LOC109215729 [Nicotiana attenuata]|uniref:uncharacterized protein LOC109215729 n=1 Tax=Nicotiana attenuata TaxID=49451 RepID=UPI000904E275|nr:PREDICTED: uncharacterized protein LOC109215729 [Nicotiana attenuata]